MSTNEAGVVFLGFCERAEPVRDFKTEVVKWNILGLKQVIVSPIAPISLVGSFMALGVRLEFVDAPKRIQVVDPNGHEVCSFLLSSTDAGESTSLRNAQGAPRIQIPRNGWTTTAVPMADLSLLLVTPGAYTVLTGMSDDAVPVGEFHFELVDVPKLTPERIAAIRSDPSAGKFVRMELGCRSCASALQVLTALERLAPNPSDRAIWYEDLPPTFVCECGQTTIDLTSIRKIFTPYLVRARLSADQ